MWTSSPTKPHNPNKTKRPSIPKNRLQQIIRPASANALSVGQTIMSVANISPAAKVIARATTTIAAMVMTDISRPTAIARPTKGQTDLIAPIIKIMSKRQWLMALMAKQTNR